MEPTNSLIEYNDLGSHQCKNDLMITLEQQCPTRYDVKNTFGMSVYSKENTFLILLFPKGAHSGSLYGKRIFSCSKGKVGARCLIIHSLLFLRYCVCFVGSITPQTTQLRYTVPTLCSGELQFVILMLLEVRLGYFIKCLNIILHLCVIVRVT